MPLSDRAGDVPAGEARLPATSEHPERTAAPARLHLVVVTTRAIGEGEPALTYDLLDALVRSNGDLQLIVDDATRVVPVATERQVATEEQTDWVGTDIR